MSIGNENLGAWLDSLPASLKKAALDSTKTVLDKRATAFGKALNRNMSIGTRKYEFLNVHTNTVLNKMNQITRKDYYGWHFIYKITGYKELSKGKKVPYALIANVTNTGRHRSTRKGRPISGNYNGTGFIFETVQECLQGIDEEIYQNFLLLTKEIK